jgi:hypothetical protein
MLGRRRKRLCSREKPGILRAVNPLIGLSRKGIGKKTYLIKRYLKASGQKERLCREKPGISSYHETINKLPKEEIPGFSLHNNSSYIIAGLFAVSLCK